MVTGTPQKTLSEGSKKSLRALVELHEELAPTGGVIVVGGGRGVGKALLLGELRKELSQTTAGRPGRLVLFGRAEHAASRPYAVLREPAQQALSFLETRGHAEEFLDAHARSLSVLLPHLLPGTAPRARDKAAFLEALRALFLDLGRHTAVTLILSDLHGADDDAKDAVRFLAQHLFSLEAGDPNEAFTGVLALGARTDDDAGAAWARSLSSGKRARSLEIGGMSREQLASYLDGHPLLDRLLAASRGRPEDVDELLESLPRDTDALLLSRVAALDPVARRAVHAVAVLGRPASPDLLAAILKAPLGDVANALSSLVDARMLARRLQNGELLFGFARAHHQEVVQQNLPPDELAMMHAAVGDALAARGPDGNEQLLAFHLLRGAAPKRGVTYALTACERLLLTFGYGTVVDLVERALVVADPAEKVALLGHLVEAQRLRGEPRLALAAAEQMRQLANDRQLPSVLRRIGELHSARGEHRAAMEALEDALARARALAGNGAGGGDEGESMPEVAAVLAAMADVAYTRGDLESVERFAGDAVAAAPKAPMAFRLRVSNVLGKIAYARERFDDAESRFLSNLRHAEENALEHEAVLARINAGLARHRRGDNDEAKEMLERALTGARAVGDLHNEAFALLNLGAIFQRNGELARALESYRAALSRFSRLGNKTEVRRAAWNLANVYASLGHYEAAQSYLDQSRHLAELDDSDRGRALVASTEGDLAMNQGQAGAALSAYERAREMFLKLGEAMSRIHETTAKAAWAAVLLGDLAHAEKRLADLPPSKLGTLMHARATAVEGALACMRSSSAGQGNGAGGNGAHASGGHASGTASGDAGASSRPTTDEAARGLSLLSSAVDELERLRAHDDAWRTLAFVAARYDDRGDPKSAEAARVRARAVVERAGEGLPEDLRRIWENDPMRAALFGRIPTKPSVPGPANAGGTLGDDAGPFEERRSYERAAPSHRRPEWDARYPELIGTAPALLRVFDRLDRIARTKSATLLVRGESGTGKELVAAAAHRLSDRAGGPFVRVNCAALVETLLMSELFGHEKGSFTGALARKIGRFELARGGTIFLDEIGDISPKTQVSLLRVLQERQFERVGGTQTIATDATVICATHRDLESMVKDNSFREDLYYRLRGVVVEMPALRERPEDIPLLALRFLSKAREEVGRAPVALSAEAEQVLTRYRWPGNIRELQNVIRSVALFCEGDVVDVEHLSEIPELFSASSHSHSHAPSPAGPAPHGNASFTAPPSGNAPVTLPPRPAPRVFEPPPPPDATRDVLRRVESTSPSANEGLALGDLKRRLEFEAISNAMRQTGGNITRAAALLKMKRPRLSQIVNGNPDLKAIKEQSRENED